MRNMLMGAMIQMGESESLTTVEVTLSRIIDENGRMAVKIKTPARYNAVELLGLLAAAQCHIFNEMNMNSG